MVLCVLFPISTEMGGDSISSVLCYHNLSLVSQCPDKQMTPQVVVVVVVVVVGYDKQYKQNLGSYSAVTQLL